MGEPMATVTSALVDDLSTIVSLTAGTLMLDVKPGPYAALTDRDLAPWAPAEGDLACPGMVALFERAAVGERPAP